MKSALITAASEATQSQQQKAVDSMMLKRFSPKFTRRSQPYRLGVRSILELRLCGIQLTTLPYVPGSAEADAYWSGQAEGKLLAPARQGGAV